MKWGQERNNGEDTEVYSIRLAKTLKHKLSTIPINTVKASLLKLVDGSHQDNVIPLDSLSPAPKSLGDSNDL